MIKRVTFGHSGDRPGRPTAEELSMNRWLTSVAKKVKKLSQSSAAPRPRRAGPVIEALEERLLMAGDLGWVDPPSNPWKYTLPSAVGQQTITVSVVGSQVQILDNGAPLPGTPLSVTGLSSITLTGGTGNTNTFNILSTPNVPVTVNLVTPRDSASVGSAHSAQSILGRLSISGWGQATVDDSADPTAHAVSAYNGVITGLTPGNNITCGGFVQMAVKANGSLGNSVTMANAVSSGNMFTGAPGKSTLATSSCALEFDNFATVRAISDFAGETATLTGSSAGANTLTARYAATTLTGPGYSLEVDSFTSVTATSTNAGDSASLYAPTGWTNQFAGLPTDSYLETTGNPSTGAVYGPSNTPYFRDARGFATVQAYSGSANDIANLRGTASGHNSFVGVSNASFLGGSGWGIQANSFNQVSVTANSASTALMGSVAGDSSSLSGIPSDGTFAGPGWYILEYGFGAVHQHVYPSLFAADSALNPASATTVNAPGTAQSPNWSGYAVTASANQVTAVGATWVVPAVTGTTGQNSSTWVGIDGFTGSTVEQVGTQQVIENGKATYRAWYELWGDYDHTAGFKSPGQPTVAGLDYHQVNIPTSSINPQPGDTISAEVYVVPGMKNTFVFRMTDTPANGGPVQNYQSLPQTTQYVTPQLSEAEWIMETPQDSNGNTQQFPSFGSVSFSGAWETINGFTGPISSFGTAKAITLATGGKTLATTGSLTDSYFSGYGEDISRQGYATASFTITQSPVSTPMNGAKLNIGTVPLLLNGAAQTAVAGRTPSAAPTGDSSFRPGSFLQTRAADVAAALLALADAGKHHRGPGLESGDFFW
jgi:hypothetical protein